MKKVGTYLYMFWELQNQEKDMVTTKKPRIAETASPPQVLPQPHVVE